MDGHENNIPEMPDWPPEVIQMLLQLAREFYPWLFQGQPVQDNVTPSQPESHTVQQPFQAWGDPNGVLGQFNMVWNPSQPAVPLPTYPAQVEVPPVQGDDGPEHHHPEFVAPPPVQDQAAGLDEPADADTPQCPCPLCGHPFERVQERNRHLRTFLPHWIYCAFPHCPYRCDRPDNLVTHRRKRHANGGQAPQPQQEYQIYDPNQLVTRVIDGHITMEQAINSALSVVEMRAQELGKEGAWAGNWWGRHLRPHMYNHSLP